MHVRDVNIHFFMWYNDYVISVLENIHKVDFIHWFGYTEPSLEMSVESLHKVTSRSIPWSSSNTLDHIAKGLHILL